MKYTCIIVNDPGMSCIIHLLQVILYFESICAFDLRGIGEISVFECCRYGCQAEPCFSISVFNDVASAI